LTERLRMPGSPGARLESNAGPLNERRIRRLEEGDRCGPCR
jgi:hypothetical protein